MTITYIPTNELIEYENNPRRNDEAVDYVARSIRDFGFRVPIVIDGNRIIVAGHTRLKAAKKLGLQVVPCIVADDLNDEQIAAFRLVDNKTSELAGWDFRALDAELGILREQGFDMDDYGFAAYEDLDIDDLFEEQEKKEKEPKRIQCECCGEWFEVD